MTHKNRTSKKICCCYAKEYQIPNQPKLQPINSEGPHGSTIKIIMPEDAFGEGSAIEDNSIDLSKNSDVKDDATDEDDFLDELLMENKIQIFKEPKRAILRRTGEYESQDEKARWTAVVKLLELYGINIELSKSFIEKTSKSNF